MPRPTLLKLPSLTDWRIRRGMSQEDLAQKAGTSRVTVGRIETGGETRVKMASRLAVALGCSVDDLRAPR